jgi:hypothetical protein
MKTETCTKCNKTKPITEMIKDKKSKTGYGKRCILCRREQQREWQEKNKDYFESLTRRQHLKSRYGITPEDYEEMLSEQKGKCAICNRHGQSSGNKRRLDIDHCHKTGKIRGLLCNRCNQSMGKVKDDIDLLKKFLAYLIGWERRHDIGT